MSIYVPSSAFHSSTLLHRSVHPRDENRHLSANHSLATAECGRTLVERGFLP